MCDFYSFLMGLGFWQWIGVLLLAGIAARVAVSWAALLVKLIQG